MIENEKTEITNDVFPNIQEVYEIVRYLPDSSLNISKSMKEGENGSLTGDEKVALIDALAKCDELFTEEGINCHIDGISANVDYDGRVFKKGQHPSMQDSLFSLDDYYDESINSVEFVMRCFFSGKSNVTLRISGLYGDDMKASVSCFLNNEKIHKVKHMAWTEGFVELFNVVQGIILEKNNAGELK